MAHTVDTQVDLCAETTASGRENINAHQEVCDEQCCIMATPMEM